MNHFMNHSILRAPAMALLAAASLLALPRAALAQAYPSKPITFVVASVPGGILDTVGRIVARGLEKMGQPVVVKNIPGAGSTLGTAAVAAAPADGYTVGMIATSHAINPSIYTKLPYDTKRDLAPISHSVNLVNVLVVHPSVPANNLKEFIELAKRKPGELTYGSAGNGQSNHLSAEMLKTATGINLIHVRYKGSAAAMNDVLGGGLTGMFVDSLSSMPHVKAGKLKALAVSSDARLPIAPEIPTFAESGLPNFNANSWLGVVARTGTPPEVIAKIGAAAAQVMHDPEVQQRLIAMGVQPVGSTPEQFARFLDAEMQRYAAAVKSAGVKLD
jgi:tripartite-type tricarboxylate transporter receptor subunit TctC